MNNLIYDLIEECTEIHDDWKTGNSYSVFDMKQFAKMVVEECVKICKEQSDIEGSDVIAEEIKKRFGAE